MIIRQILLVSTLVNVQRTVWGMWILNFRERKERASESEINWTDQTPGTFRSRLVFKPVYPNSPNTRENVRERVVAVSYRPQGWSFCLPQSAQDKWPTVSGRNLILYSNCFSICFINGNWKYLYFFAQRKGNSRFII